MRGRKSEPGNYSISYENTISNTADYTQKVDSIKICRIDGHSTIFLQVNSPGNSCGNPITAGYCKGNSLTLIPASSSHPSSPNPLILTSTARVKKIDVRHADTFKTNMIGICFQLEDQSTTTNYCYGSDGNYNNTWSSSTQEFIGFKVGMSTSGTTCKLTGLSVYQRPITQTTCTTPCPADPCASETIQTINVSEFNSGNLNLVIGETQAYILTSTTAGGNTCDISYQITVTGPNPGLISLQWDMITFDTSDVLQDAGLYSIAVQAKTTAQTTWSDATIATFNYVDPCLAATMPASGTCPAGFPVSLRTNQASSTFAIFQDSVTSAKNNGTIICAQTVSFYVASAPSPKANETMVQKFTNAVTSSTSTNGTQTISAAPTLINEVGTYDLNAVACVTANPTSCKMMCSIAVTVTNPCRLTTITGPTQVQNFIVFAGQNQTSSSSYTFKDSISEALTLSSDSFDFCGEKEFSFKINSVNSTLLSGNNKQNITFLPISNSTVFGTFSAQLLIYMKDYPTICKKIDFNVTVLPMPTPIAQKQPPYFDPALKDVIVNICPGQQKVLWKFVIPSPIDPNNGTVSLKVSLNPIYFTFNDTTNTIQQNNKQREPLNQTLGIQLVNFFNFSATYSIKVEFSCKEQQYSNETTNFSTTTGLNQTKNTNWPLAYIKTVDQDGLVHIAFRQLMKIPENITQILDGTVRINEQDYPNLLITVIPGRLSQKKLLNLTTQFVNFTTSELLIQLNFQNIQYVSFNSKYREQIQVQIYGSHLFADNHANYMQRGVILGPVYLPCLTSVSEYLQSKKAADIFKTIMSIIMLSSSVSAFFISQPLQSLLESIRHLQIITHAMLLDLAYPVTANVYTGMLMDILTFQVVSFVDFFNKILSFDPNDDGNNPYNIQFNAMGYEAMYIIQNFGMLCFTIFVTPALYILVLLLHQKFPKDMEKLKQSWNRSMFYGTWIKLINETYLFLSVCAMINCQYLKFDTYGRAINSLCAVICAIVLNVFPFFVIIFYNLPKNYQKILNEDEDFMARYGQLLEGLNFLRMGQKGTLYAFFSLLRKQWLVYVVVYMQDKPVYSLIQIIYQAILMITLVGYIQPFKSRLDNRIELFNETCMLLVTYHLLTFTDFLQDAPTREYVGYSLVTTILTCILVNLCKVIYIMGTIFLSKSKINYYRWRHSEAAKSIQKNSLKRQQQEKAERQEKMEENKNKHKKAQQEQQLNFKERKFSDQQSEKIQKLQQSSRSLNERISEAQKNREINKQKFKPKVAKEKQQITKKIKNDEELENKVHFQKRKNNQNFTLNQNFHNQLTKKDKIHQLENAFAQQSAQQIHFGQFQNQLYQKDLRGDLLWRDYLTPYEDEMHSLSRRDQDRNYNQMQLQEENKFFLDDQSKTKTQNQQIKPLNQFYSYGLNGFDGVPVNFPQVEHQEDVLLDYSYRDQHQSNQQQNWNKVNNFISKNYEFEISNPNQNFNLVERQYVAVKPKHSNNPTFGEKIFKTLTLAPTVDFKKFTTPVDQRLSNQKIVNNGNYNYKNQLEQKLQLTQAIIPQTKLQQNKEDTHAQLPEVLKGLRQKYRKNFEEMFRVIPAHIQIDLCQLFCKMDEQKSLDFKEFQQCLTQVCLPLEGLYDYAMKWSQNNSVNAEFAKEEGIDFEFAVDYRNGKIPTLVRRCTEAQIENDEHIRSGWYGQLPRLKNLAFDKVPIIEDFGFMNSVAGQVYWYKSLIQSQELRNYYPEIFGSSSN